MVCATLITHTCLGISLSLSLTKSSRPHILSRCIIPNSLFNGTAPKLTRLELLGCSIGWKSPLLKGLQTLKMLAPSVEDMPKLEDWLDALNEMSQLKTLILDNAIPAIAIDYPHIPEPQRTVTLPSLTHFDIAGPVVECMFALAHLVLPVLISLHVTSKAQPGCWYDSDDDIRFLIPYVARNVHGPQDTAPLQTILFNGEEMGAEIVAWTAPDADIDVCDSVTLIKAAASAHLVLSVTSEGGWHDGMETVIFDAMLSHLPLNAISMLSAQNNTRLSKQVWLSHSPRLIKLNWVLLVSTVVRALREMLEEDVPPNGRPRLPQLTKLILSKVSLTVLRTHHLCNMLVKRKEHGSPLEALDLRTCIGTEHAIKLLSETVGNVQGPTETLKVGHSAFFGWGGRASPFDEEEEHADDDGYDDGPGSWYGSMGEGTESERDEDESDGYDDDYYSDLYIDHL